MDISNDLNNFKVEEFEKDENNAEKLFAERNQPQEKEEPNNDFAKNAKTDKEFKVQEQEVFDHNKWLMNELNKNKKVQNEAQPIEIVSEDISNIPDEHFSDESTQTFLSFLMNIFLMQ